MTEASFQATEVGNSQNEGKHAVPMSQYPAQ